jgi:hypothetical protein
VIRAAVGDVGPSSSMPMNHGEAHLRKTLFSFAGP